jgi:hypothetical protein
MADKNFTRSWRANVGLNHTPAYQVSGRPFATGSVDTTVSGGHKIEFPYVTRWIYVANHGNDACRIGYSQLGVLGTNYLRVAMPDADANSAPATVRLEVKVSEIWLSGSNSVDVMAGLTTIPISRVSGSTGPSFSGSVGVG